MSNERDNVEDDVRDSLAALVSEGGETGAEVANATGAAEGETSEQRQARIDARGNVHDEAGKFAGKSKSAVDEIVSGTDKLIGTPDPAKVLADQEASKNAKALQPPPHWSPEAKAAFVNAPRPLQEQALKREEEISGKAKEWQGKAEDYNRLERVIAPHRDRLAREGRDPVAAINQLFAFENAMQSNPVNGVAEILKVFARGNELAVINMIAQQNGYVLAQADNQGNAAQGRPAASADPTVGRLYEQVQYLTNHLTQQQQAAFQGQQEQVLSEVRAFAANPENLYYENVKGIIARLVSEGDESGDARPIHVRLKEAYDKAVWADPSTRTLMLQDQQRKASAEESRRVQAARHAGGSIAGSPEQGSYNPGGRRSQRDDIEADVRAAALELAGR